MPSTNSSTQNNLTLFTKSATDMYAIEINLTDKSNAAEVLREVAKLIENDYTHGILDDGSTWTIGEY